MTQTCEHSVFVGQLQGCKTRQMSDGQPAFYQTAHMRSAPSHRLDTRTPTSIVTEYPHKR